MEPSEAELFEILESEVRGIDKDITSQVRTITRSAELFFWQRWGNGMPFDQVNMYTFPTATVSVIGEDISMKARREWHRNGELPRVGDLVTFRLTSGYTPYQVFSNEKETTLRYFDDEQWVSGEFCCLAVDKFMLESYLHPDVPLPDDTNMAVNPFGLHAVIENVTIGSRQPGEFKPQESDRLYIPLHYDIMRISMLPSEAE